MLALIEAKADNEKAQKVLLRSLKKTLKLQGSYTIGFRVPSGQRNPTLPVYSGGKGELWFCSGCLEDIPIPRHWNAFGIFDPNRTAQAISVELNIATESNTKQVAGYFLKDTRTDIVYLMHSGGVGGGTAGIGKRAFLGWSRLVPEIVIDSDGEERFGILIGRVDDSTIVSRVDEFVREVAAFKKLAKDGALDTPDYRKRLVAFNRSSEEFERFKSEFSGRKKGHRGRTVDYVSIHGKIVDALKKWREGTVTSQSAEEVFNNLLIDLYVKRHGKLTEVYKVKPRVDRQSIYTAIGQLVVHSGGGGKPLKYLVLPTKENLPHDVAQGLDEIGIRVLRFSFDRRTYSFAPA